MSETGDLIGAQLRRRSFLRATALGAGGVAAGPTVGKLVQAEGLPYPYNFPSRRRRRRPAA